METKCYSLMQAAIQPSITPSYECLLYKVPAEEIEKYFGLHLSTAVRPQDYIIVEHKDFELHIEYDFCTDTGPESNTILTIEE